MPMKATVAIRVRDPTLRREGSPTRPQANVERAEDGSDDQQPDLEHLPQGSGPIEPTNLHDHAPRMPQGLAIDDN